MSGEGKYIVCCSTVERNGTVWGIEKRGGDVPYVESQNMICTADRLSDEVRLPARVLRSLRAYFVTTFRAHLHVPTSSHH